MSYAAFHDWRTRTIPLWMGIAFLIIACLQGFFISAPSPIGIGLLLFIGLTLATLRYIGWGDVIFLILAGFLIPLEDIPLFLIIAGAIGLPIAFFYTTQYNTREFPLIPSLSIALIVCILVAC